MRSEFGRPVGDLGLVISTSIAAYGAIATVSGWLTARLGAGGVLLIAYMFVTAGVFTLLVAPSFVVFLAGTTLLSAGNGLLDPAINTYVARFHGVRTMNLLHTSFGLGATIGPIMMVRRLDRSGRWQAGYEPVLVFAVAMVAVMLATRRRWGVRASIADRERPSDVRLMAAASTMVGFAFAGGIEAATGQWAFSILVEDRDVAQGLAGAFVASFWGGLTLGRLFGAFWGGRFALGVIVRSSVVTVILGLGWLAFAPFMAPLGLPVAGAGMALIFPTLVIRAAARFGPAADTVIGWGFGAMSVGVAVLPYGLGRLAEVWDLGVVAPALVAIALMLAASIGIHREQPADRPGKTSNATEQHP